MGSLRFRLALVLFLLVAVPLLSFTLATQSRVENQLRLQAENAAVEASRRGARALDRWIAERRQALVELARAGRSPTSGEESAGLPRLRGFLELRATAAAQTRPVPAAELVIEVPGTTPGACLAGVLSLSEAAQAARRAAGPSYEVRLHAAGGRGEARLLESGDGPRASAPAQAAGLDVEVCDVRGTHAGFGRSLRSGSASLALLGVLIAAVVAFVVSGRVAGAIETSRKALQTFDPERPWSPVSGASEDLGSVLQIVDAVRDRVTLRFRQTLERVRRLESAEGERERLFAQVSHDLRSPLHAIRGIAEAVQEGMDGDVTPELDEHMRIVVRNCNEVLRLVNTILDLAKIEAGSMRLQPLDFELVELLRHVEGTARGLVGRRPVQIRVDNACGALLVHADRARLLQVLQNLVGNAIKFTDHGSVVVRVQPAEAGLRFEVRDSGAGIRSEDQERLFEAFAQSEAGMLRANDSTGLGLAISRRLVEMMGGSMELQSEPGRGSTFGFTITCSPRQPQPSL
ncbi:MAG: ATP-binding protein [Candidatus Krumholzibacteriia bacterium]